MKNAGFGTVVRLVRRCGILSPSRAVPTNTSCNDVTFLVLFQSNLHGGLYG
jgi:hypothetical protein